MQYSVLLLEKGSLHKGVQGQCYLLDEYLAHHTELLFHRRGRECRTQVVQIVQYCRTVDFADNLRVMMTNKKFNENHFYKRLEQPKVCVSTDIHHQEG
jgi:hypothetical protein